MRSHLVVGANRGLGLGLVQELLEDPDNFIIATTRGGRHGQELEQLTSTLPKSRLVVINHLEITDQGRVDQAAKEAEALLPNGLDCLIHSAAVDLQALIPFEQIDLDMLEEELRINTIAPLRILRAFLPLVRRSQAADKKIALVTSRLGSVTLSANFPGLCDAYSITKAGLNMIGRKWGSVLRKEGITTVLVEPGWVDTVMGSSIETWVNECAPGYPRLSPREAAKNFFKLLKDVTLEDGDPYWDCQLGTRLLY